MYIYDSVSRALLVPTMKTALVLQLIFAFGLQYSSGQGTLAISVLHYCGVKNYTLSFIVTLTLKTDGRVAYGSGQIVITCMYNM